MPDEIVEEVALAVLNRVGERPETDGAVLSLLAEAMEARLGPDHQATLNALSQLANSDRSGHGAGRVVAIRKVLASYHRQGREEEALMAELGLAMAQSDTGDLEGALRVAGRHRLRTHQGRVGQLHPQPRQGSGRVSLQVVGAVCGPSEAGQQ